MSEFVLQMKNISKAFPGVKALECVSLELKRGEILALVGENGAGKSTLMKILSGVYRQDSGEVVFKGNALGEYTPSEAINMGISIIYQELNDLPELTVAANIFTGRLPKKGCFIDYKKLKEMSLEAQKMVGLEGLNPFETVGGLKVAQKQLIEIARSFVRKADVIVMDEPTATLTNAEINVLYGIMKKFTAEGGAVIIITHKLEEVFEIADRAMVLRDGQNVGAWPTAEVTKDELVTAMVGRELKGAYAMQPREIGDVVLEVDGLTNELIKDVSFKLRAGEVLGLYGLLGAGCDTLTRCIYGVEKFSKGIIKIAGMDRPVRHITPTQSLKYGMAFVPSERKREGLMLDQSVKSNITLSSLSQIKNKLTLNFKKEKIIAKEWVAKLTIKTPTIDTEADSLSGGNQQKIVFAKVMNTVPKVLILNEPTRGVDVGAKAEIYKIIEAFCKQGVAILMVSSEMTETMSISDRVLAFYNGRQTREFRKGEYTQIDLLQAVIGGNGQ